MLLLMLYPRIIDASMGMNNWSVASHHLSLLSAWYLTPLYMHFRLPFGYMSF